MSKKLMTADYFWKSLYNNNRSYNYYFERLMELAISMFEWKNLPETVDERFLELILFCDGKAVFFNDPDIGELALQVHGISNFNVYRIPIDREAFGVNGYHRKLDINDSVIIYNNYAHTNSLMQINMFAERLYDLDQTIDVNAKAQKTPIIIQCTDEQKLTMQNLWKKYNGNELMILADKKLDDQPIRVLKTEAPYHGEELYQLKNRIWNEALTYLGISNMNQTKKERLIAEEAQRQQGGTIASRYSRLNSRKEACKQINKMFGLDIDVDFRKDFLVIEEDGEENG